MICGIVVASIFLVTSNVYVTASTKPSHQRPLPIVDMKVTPPGWSPLDYGDLQVSVPATWVIGLGCPGLSDVPGWISLGGISGVFNCPLERHLPANSVSIEYASPSPVAYGTSETINGLSVSKETSLPKCGDEQCSSTYVPSLGVTIGLTGPLSQHVLRTLTYSPRAVALAPGPYARAPSGWHRVLFGGIGAEVPPTWRTEAGNWVGTCNPTMLLSANEQSVVTTDAGSVQSGPPVCPRVSSLKIEQPRDGLVIDPGPYGPIAHGATFASCMKVNGLSVCPTTPKAYYPAVPATTDLGGVLVASVHVPGEQIPVAIELGLAGGGITARTILHSLRAG